jgi:hypothetical protein
LQRHVWLASLFTSCKARSYSVDTWTFPDYLYDNDDGIYYSLCVVIVTILLHLFRYINNISRSKGDQTIQKIISIFILVTSFIKSHVFFFYHKIINYM